MKPAKRRAKKKIRRKTKGLAVKFVKKKTKIIKCSCGAVISKGGKRPNRLFRNLCTRCARERIMEGIK